LDRFTVKLRNLPKTKNPQHLEFELEKFIKKSLKHEKTKALRLYKKNTDKPHDWKEDKLTDIVSINLIEQDFDRMNKLR
jgi:hypothetical protein